MSELASPYQIPRTNPQEQCFEANTDSCGVFPLPFTAEPNPMYAGGVGRIIHNKTIRSMALILPSTIAEAMPNTQSRLAVERDTTNGDVYYIAPDTPDEYVDRFKSRRHAMIEAYNPSHNKTPALPRHIDIEQAVQLIQEQNPTNILFYTGSGISAANIWTHESLARNAGFVMRNPNEGGLAKNTLFARRFMQSEETLSGVRQTFDTYVDQVHNARPTAAHSAFSIIMQRLGDKPLAATTNHDTLHQQTGLQVPQVRYQWPDTKASPLDEERAFGVELERRAGSIGLIVAIGVGDDEKGIFAHIKKANPAATILASNVNRATNLAYMYSADMLLPGNCQSTLRQLANAL
jgi:hypothetical protein